MPTEGERSTGIFANTPIAPATFARVTAALACVLLTSYLMTHVMFPLLDASHAGTHVVASLAQALFLVSVGLAATFRPALLGALRLWPIATVLMLAGVALQPLSFAWGNPAFLQATAALFAIGRAAALLAATLALARWLTREGIFAAVAIAFAVATAFQPAFWLLPWIAGLIACLALPCIALGLAYRDANALTAIAIAGEPPADAAITRPASFLPLASQVFVCLFLFRLAFGYALTFGDPVGSLTGAFAMTMLVALAAVLMLKWSRFDADLLTSIAILLGIAGFLIVTTDDPTFQDAYNLFLLSGDALFDLVSWMVIAAASSRNPAGALAVAGWGSGVSSLGSFLGAEIGSLTDSLLAHDPTVLTAFSGALLIPLVAYALIGLKRFSFRETIEGVVPVEGPDVRVESPEEQFQARCESIAGEYRLTPRETEIFAMLARGRDRAYIQEKLVLSKSTVKTHVRHVYEKLDIHSHQELIDLVEQ